MKIDTSKTFDNFIKLNSNEYALKIAKAITKDLNNNFSPLFIYSNSSLGKTHLLNAIYNQVAANYPNVKVIAKNADEITYEYVTSIQKSTENEFENKYKNADFLLIDNIEFLLNKDATQEVIANIVADFIDCKKHIIITSACIINELSSFNLKLISRIKSSNIAELLPLNNNDKCIVIREYAKKFNIFLENDTIDFIAHNTQSNFFQIIGIIKNIAMLCEFDNKTPSVSTAKYAIKKYGTCL